MKGTATETRKLLSRVITSRAAEISIENTRTDGDIDFVVQLADVGLVPADLSDQIMRTKFFVNFLGELLVRDDIQRFIGILDGLDSKMYEDMVCSQQHADFGMIIDREKGLLRFTMHLSLADEIARERFNGDDGEGLFGLEATSGSSTSSEDD